MEATTDYPSFFKPLSLRVCRVLDDIGASEEIRRMRINIATTREILHTITTKFVKDGTFSLYVFGSVAEGTTTGGLDSDVDYVYTIEEWSVVDNIEKVPVDKPLSLLMVKDETTKAGYIKLQCVINKIPWFGAESNITLTEPFKVDCNERIVFCRPPTPGIGFEIHGPAYSTEATTGYVAHDHVYALRCLEWPDCVKPWLNRPRQHNWPPPDLIEKLKNFCVFVVPVGHPQSKEQDKEWRLSTSLQERLLMQSLNPTQYKCYVILKMVKKDVLAKLVGEESVSSYILKTCIFYTAESTPSTFWRPDNILVCLQYCLNCLLQWTISGNCPNYFIPEENMLERIPADVQVKLQHALRKLISAQCKYLPMLSSDGLGRRLEAAMLNILRELEHAGHSPCCNNEGIVTTYATLRIQANYSRNEILRKICNNTSIENYTQALYEGVSALKKIGKITEHTEEETRQAISTVLPYIELSLMSAITAQESDPEMAWMYLTSQKWNDLTLESDLFSPKLKQATHLYMKGHYEASLAVLQSLSSANSAKVTSICHCRGLPIHRPKDTDPLPTNVLKSDFYQTYFAPCIAFLPAEKTLVPVALQYEMMRSSDMPANTRNELLQYWFDWAAVDSKILLYFMLYLNHHKLRKDAEKRANIEKIEWLIRTDENIAHKETALNLLGWAFRQEGYTENAVVCFEASLLLHKTHNAATLHLKDIDNSKLDAPKVIYSREGHKL